MFSPAPVPRHLEFMQQELDSARTASAALPAVPPTHDAAAIRAAAAELAERISAADQSSATSPGPPRFSQLRAVTPQPAATSKQQESNVLALKLTVVAGPSTDTSYVTAKDTKQVVIGRLPANTLSIDDPEVSGTHLILRWLEPEDGGAPCWQVADAGSLNGTLLNGTRISVPGRKRSAAYRLNSDDLLQLGTATAIKVLYMPRELLEQKVLKAPRLRTLSGVNAPPPPIQRTPSRDGLHRAPAAASSEALPPAQVAGAISIPELAITGYALSKVGQEHERRSQVCEDVIRWVPDLLPGSGQSLPRLSAAAAAKQARVLLRSTTTESSPALTQFLQLYGSASANSSNSSNVSSGTMRSSEAGDVAAHTRGTGQMGASTVLSSAELSNPPALATAHLLGNAAPSQPQGARSITSIFDAAGVPGVGTGGGGDHPPLAVTASHTDAWSPLPAEADLLRQAARVGPETADNSPSNLAPGEGITGSRSTAPTIPASSARPSLDDARGMLGDGGHSGSSLGGMMRLGSSSGSHSFSRYSFDEGITVGGPPAALFCVLDGHCGRTAAQQASSLLPRELATRIDPRQLGQGHAPNAAVWEDAFSTTDHGLECEDGCTATAALAWRDDSGAVCLQTANVGDSTGIFIAMAPGRAHRVVQLTADHRWTSKDERSRLSLMGIQLEGRTRLYGLNLSRCLGDKFLKDEDLGLSSQPSVSDVVRLPRGSSSGGGVLVLASDGLWDVADSNAVAQVVMKSLPDGTQAAAEALLQLALSHRSRDDVSVLLLHVQP